MTELLQQFKAAVSTRDVSRAEKLRKLYLQGGGQPRHWMFNMLITMHARRYDLDRAVSTADSMKEAGLAWDTVTYSAVIDALSKAEMPPYLLDRKYASMAWRYYADMREAGVPPNHFTFHSLMDCQAKAGLIDDAFAVLEEMKKSGVAPNLFTYNVLVNACAKANCPRMAQEVVGEIMPRAGIEADTVTWNALLGAFAQAGQIDNAYHTWEEMKKRGILPTRVTESHLSEAMVGSPLFLEELLEETKQMKVAAAQTSEVLGRAASAGAKTTDSSAGACGQGQESLCQTDDNPWKLDLHRLSQTSAQAQLLRRLRLLAGLRQVRKGTLQPSSAGGDLQCSKPGKGLIIITGIGRHSRKRGAGVLGDVVKTVLNSNKVRYKACANAGRIIVPEEEIAALGRRKSDVEAKAQMLRGASMRVMFLGCAVFGVLSTTYLLRDATLWM